MPSSRPSPEASSFLAAALERIDQSNARDPRLDEADGEAVPKELLYGHRMSEALSRLAPDASEALQIAVRAQHIRRWEIPRTEFPLGRQGYKRWRTRLMEHHARVAAQILEEVGYDSSTIERVGSLLRKEGLKRDPETQTLEDVACLVFLEHYFDDFARDHDDEKLVSILRKTWRKMSEPGREAARELELSERALRLVREAVDPQSGSSPRSDRG